MVLSTRYSDSPVRLTAVIFGVRRWRKGGWICAPWAFSDCLTRSAHQPRIPPTLVEAAAPVDRVVLTVELIQFCGILSIDFALDLRVDPLAIAVDGFLGARESGDAVRIVAGPEEIIFAVNRGRQHAGAVVLIGEINIFFEILAGRAFVDVAIGIESAFAAEPVVNLLNQVGHPTDIVLGADEFELGMAVQVS